MGEPLASNGLDRRAFLLGSGIAVSALAGCLEDDPEAETESTGDGNGADDDGENDENGESDGGGRTAPTVPEPDFTVGPSDEADYETLQAAYDALESGDVIGIEPGTYAVQPPVVRADDEGEELTKTYTYVGESADETTIEIEMPDEPSFSVDGLLHFLPEDGAPGFWQTTVDIPAGVEFVRVDEYDEDEFEEYESERIDAHYATVNGSFGGPTEAYETTFASDISHELVPTECRFRGDVGGPVISARRCQFYSDLGSRGGYAFDSTIEGTADLNEMRLLRCEIRGGVTVNGGGSIENCVVDPKPSSTLAIDIRSEYEASVVESEIRGTVRSNRDGSHIDRFELNTFDVPDGTSYIIDGAPATDIYLNAFLGGDVRITTDTGDLDSFPADELTLYDAERELGNYYSEWDRTDSADEGTIDTRTLPGDDGEMDRYPLANPDIEAYAEAAEEDEDEDD